MDRFAANLSSLAKLSYAKLIPALALGLFALLISAPNSVKAQSTSGHIDPSQQTPDSVSINKGLIMYFRPSSYSSMACTDPRSAVDANLIAQGQVVFGDPSVDAQWMERKKSDKNCWQQAIDKRFTVTQAVSVFVNDAMIFWVVGIKVPSTGKVVGYMPLEQIQYVPLATPY